MIAFVRLLTGEDLVGDVDAPTDLGITISHPMKIIYYADNRETGKITMGFMHWVFPGITENQEFPLPFDQIVVFKPATEIIAGRYKEHLAAYEDAMSDMDPKEEAEYDDTLPTDSDKLK